MFRTFLKYFKYLYEKSMFIFSYLIVIILGLYFGSFLTATSLRLVNNQKLFSKNSFCDSCGTRIKFLRLIPVIGYITSKGKCSFCKNQIPVKYTIWEIIHCCAFVLNFAVFGNNIPSFLTFTLLTTTMFVIAVIDLETMYVYNIHIFIFGILLAAFLYVNNILQIEFLSFIAALIPLFFKISYEYIREKITKNKVVIVGWGDVYIFIILFFLLDFLNIAIIILLSGLFGILFGILRKSEYSNHYPFIPSISLSVYTIFIWKFL